MEKVRMGWKCCTGYSALYIRWGEARNGVATGVDTASVSPVRAIFSSGVRLAVRAGAVLLEILCPLYQKRSGRYHEQTRICPDFSQIPCLCRFRFKLSVSLLGVSTIAPPPPTISDSSMIPCSRMEAAGNKLRACTNTCCSVSAFRVHHCNGAMMLRLLLASDACYDTGSTCSSNHL